MIRALLLIVATINVAVGFVVVPVNLQTQQVLHTTTWNEETTYSSDDAALEWISQQLKLEVYDPDTSVYGFGSKNRQFGIEVIRVSLPVVESSLGLDLVELAHGEREGDSRGLVLINSVSVIVEKIGKVKTGDTIIGVFVGDKFKESTTALNLEETMKVLEEAKNYAEDNGIVSIDLELNRLVARQKVRVLLDSDWRDRESTLPKETEIEALSGDNLRTLLMHHNVRVYDERTIRLDTLGTGDCGGEGICGTCLVEVLEGMETLNPKSVKEEEILTGRPANWRASCRVVVGANNLPGETVRIRLCPQSSLEDELRHPGSKAPRVSP